MHHVFLKMKLRHFDVTERARLQQRFPTGTRNYSIVLFFFRHTFDYLFKFTESEGILEGVQCHELETSEETDSDSENGTWNRNLRVQAGAIIAPGLFRSSLRSMNIQVAL